MLIKKINFIKSIAKHNNKLSQSLLNLTQSSQHEYLRLSYSLSNKKFCSKINEEKNKNDQEETINNENSPLSEKSEVQKELEETPEERLKRIELEEKKKFLQATYTQEELDALNQKGEEVVIMEIKPQNKKKLLLAKKLSLYLNIPMSILIMVLIDYGFGDVTDMNPKKRPLYYAALTLDYMFFLNGIAIMAGLRNMVLLAKYIPKEKVVEFTKLNFFSKPYKIIEKVDELKRIGGGSNKLTPFLSLKNRISNNMYSMNGIGEWKDRKLFNALFPIHKPVAKSKSKKEGQKFLDL
jgi:hypothetical protein